MLGRRKPGFGQQLLASLLACLLLAPGPVVAQVTAPMPMTVPAQPGSGAKTPAEGQATGPPTTQEPAPVQVPKPAGIEPKGEEKGEKVQPEAQKKQTPSETKGAKPVAPESPFARLLAQQSLGVVEGVSLDILPFGYNLFQARAAGLPPGGYTPVGADYVLGPDDEFTVTIWGMVDGVYKVRVSREGVVAFPRVGEVSVAGVTYGELKGHIARAFAKHFKNFQLSVTMGQLRAIQVFVVGEVQAPGNHVLSSLSTVLSALFAAEGPTTNGTLRDLRVLRNGKIAAHVDLYEFLLKGDKSHDVRLQDQDTVFVPLVGPIIGVAGDVKRPAIYELLGSATLGDVLDLAGGVRPTGYLARVQVERVVEHEKRIAVDLNLATPGNAPRPSPLPRGERGEGAVDALRMPVRNMDMVKVFPINPIMQGVVYLKGHVVRPGPYEFKAGMRVTDVLKEPGDLLPEVFADYARIVRFSEPDRVKRIIPFNLQRALTGDPSANFELQSLDQIEVYSKDEFRAFPSVSVVGEVRKPGVYPLLQNMRVSDLIVVAGGLQKLAYAKKAELTRYAVVSGTTTMSLLNVDLEQAMAGNPSFNIELQELDTLAVRPIPESEVGRSVTVKGEVKLPGEYTIKRGERLSSVLKRAGGFAERAFPNGLVLIRESTKQVQQSEIQKFVAAQKQKLTIQAAGVSAGTAQMQTGPVATPAGGQTFAQSTLQMQIQALDQLALQLAPGRVVVKLTSIEDLEGTTDDILLEPGDQISVPQQPSTVTILGSVRNATSVLYRKGLILDDYINQAGGVTPDAKKDEMYIVRADGSTLTPSAMERLVEAGDTIVVPADIEPKVPKLPLWSAVASIIGSIMLGVAAIAVIGR